MTVLAVLLAAGAAAVAASSDRGAPARLAALARAAPRPAPWRAPPGLAACVVAALALALLDGGAVGIALGGALVLLGPPLLGRLEPQTVRAERERLLSDVPLALELMAACLAGGATVAAAADAVGAAVAGPCGRRLAAVSAALSVGSPAEEAWTVLAAGRADDPLSPAARALARAAEGGAPVSAAVARLAQDARADARARAEQAARRVGVLAVAPLGLCFLPAFVLLGVVPVIAGLAAPVLAAF